LDIFLHQFFGILFPDALEQSLRHSGALVESLDTAALRHGMAFKIPVMQVPPVEDIPIVTGFISGLPPKPLDRGLQPMPPEILRGSQVERSDGHLFPASHTIPRILYIEALRIASFPDGDEAEPADYSCQAFHRAGNSCAPDLCTG
jgi:hypothetical protein